MDIPQKAIEEFKEISKRKYGKELTDQEAYESASNLLGLVKLMYDLAVKDIQRKRRLKKEPDGFVLEDGYTCGLCHGGYDQQKWYHWYGIACSLCRKAIADGAVPAFAVQHRKSWYATWELESKFGIKSPTVRKLVRQGKLVARIVLGENGKPYEYIFLKKENPEFIDPERDSAGMKSWKRNRDKTTEASIREERAKKSHINR